MSQLPDTMPSPATSEERAPTTRPRQRPGSACEECRRKKLRCDRKTPCGGCVDSGVKCHVNAARPERGPKRGHLKVLRSRIAALERRINEQDETLISPGGQHLELDDDVYVGTRGPPSPLPEVSSGEEQQSTNPPPIQLPDLRAPESLGATGAPIPTLTRADLDQLFFDRVYNFTPILQQSRYFSWSKQPWSSASHICLQYAVWTLAASLSSQFQPLRDGLYRDTRQMLETLELEDSAHEECFHLELAQAWILVAIYEFTQTTFRRAWISAGRAFRFVQLMKLNEIDYLACLSADALGTSEEWVQTEEKSRTFWMAYCLDRFCCGLKGLPLTLNEQVISTRLPAPEVEFQSGTPIQTPFLSQVMATNDLTILSPFTECIIFSTLWGRSLCYQQKSTVEQVYGNAITEFWDRYLCLENIVTQRVQLLLRNYPPASVRVDSMLLFTSMIAQATVLSLCKVTESILWSADVVTEYQRKSVAAAQEIAKLSKYMRQLSYFKVHPFTPIPLFLCGEYFTTHRGLDVSFETALLEITEALRELRNVNTAGRNYLELLESNPSDEFLDFLSKDLEFTL